MAADAEYAPSPKTRVREQVAEYESSGGCRGTTVQGQPVIIVTTIGARTGNIRKVPLMRAEQDGRYAVVASHGGQPMHPHWYHNLVADPRVTVQDGPRKLELYAREVFGAEKAEWWKRVTAVWPDFDDHQAKAEREIPLFVLEPVPADEH